MNLRTYWQQDTSAYHEVLHQLQMEELAVEEAKLEAKFAQVRAVPCNCELLDAHQCFASTRGTEEGDDSKYCRCRCHKIADRQGLID